MKGEGKVGIDEGGGNGAAGPSSSVGGGSLSAVCASRSSVARRRCLWEGRRRPLGIMVACGGT